MKKAHLLYIPLVLLFAFSASALYTHFSQAGPRYERLAGDYLMPFSVDGDKVQFVRPEAQRAGLKTNDRIISVNGQKFGSTAEMHRELEKSALGTPLQLELESTDENSLVASKSAYVEPVKNVRDANYYSRLTAGFIFSYILPAFCTLLGFWVVFMRPRDFLAWLLLFLLLGMSSIGFEGYSQRSLVAAYRGITGSGWALSMLLFGIYFPERLKFDKRVPWLKWILIVPLAYQVVISILSRVMSILGSDAFSFLRPVNALYEEISGPLNILAIGLFFACLGWKSGTLRSADARRRLRLMVVGTCVALAPACLIVVYGVISGVRGSFFDIAPTWAALLALTLLMLFPLTMAYVIVVQRAMDVSVVIRQGLQYALARNGIKVLQLGMLILLIFGVIWISRNLEGNFASQIGFVAAGFALIPLIDYGAKRLRTGIDRKFFREAYDTEQILLGLSEDVRTMVETRPLLETLSTTISESLHVPQIAMLLKYGDSFKPAYALGYDSLPTAQLSGTGNTASQLRKNEPVIIYKDGSDTWLGDNSDESRSLGELNSQLLLPVGVKNELSGVISLGPKLSEEPYSPNDIRLLKSVAAQTGLALENSRLTEAFAAEAAQKERLNRELEIAREVQERLFPQELPPVAGIEYYGACRPALGVGGDYYDFLELESGKFGFAIGDVSGKGIGASLMMASLQASLRGQAIHFKDDLASLMYQINRLVYETSTTNRYATFFYAQYDPTDKKLTYVNAGHNPPFLLRKSPAGDEITTLTVGGAVVGMLPPMLVQYEQGELFLRPGDLLVGFTDGISEAMNPNEEEWSEDAMLEELKQMDGHSPNEILSRIVAAADSFASGAKQHDDMTMIVIRVL